MTIIDRIAIGTNSLDLNPPLQPDTIVLQPNGVLSRDTSFTFQQALEQALEQAVVSVIVDFLWVSSTDMYGIAALVAGIQRATNLGKFLGFQAMDVGTQTALELEWNCQREKMFGTWNNLFQNDLEQFLDQRMK